MIPQPYEKFELFWLRGVNHTAESSLTRGIKQGISWKIRGHLQKCVHILDFCPFGKNGKLSKLSVLGHMQGLKPLGGVWDLMELDPVGSETSPTMVLRPRVFRGRGIWFFEVLEVAESDSIITLQIVLDCSRQNA
jgi:hypothetical protein